MKYQIDIEMCGSEATAAIARRTAEILASDGYDCEFVECADNRYCDVEIPDSVFYAAVGRAASDVEV